MSVSETVFSKVYRKFKFGRAVASTSHYVHIEEIQERLHSLMSAIAEKKLEVRIGDSFENRLDGILFPLQVGIFSDKNKNEQFCVLRAVAYAIGIKTIGLEAGWRGRIESYAKENYPVYFQHLSTFNFSDLKITGQEKFPLTGDLFGEEPKRFLDLTSKQNSASFPEQENGIVKPITEIQSKKAKKKAERKEIKESEANPFTHAFEKILTAEEYQGGSKKMDDSDELEEHKDALNELEISQVILTNKQTKSLYRGEIFLEQQEETGADKKEQTIQYPEWSYRKAAYLQNWCTLTETDSFATEAAPLTSDPLARRLSQDFSLVLNRKRLLNRLREGDAHNLDCLVDHMVQRKMGIQPEERIYEKNFPQIRDINILVLVDRSLSTDSWVKNHRVIDLAKRSLMIFGEAMEKIEPSIGIASFYSYTRQNNQFEWIKRAENEWGNWREKVNALKPEGYTRVGPAIRHATQCLNRSTAKRKVLILLSDAKPSDYDLYEGVHGEQDVRRAVEEDKGKNIFVKALSLCERGDTNLERMYGRYNFAYIQKSEDFPREVLHIFRQCGA